MAAKKTVRRKSARLGKGLSSLMAQPVAVKGDKDADDSAGKQGDSTSTSGPGSSPPPSSDGLVQLPADAIRPNPQQPRKSFDSAALQHLADSIRADGMMQPIIVRPVADAQSGKGAITHELVAGERRWRAAQLAGVAHVPAVVRELTDRQMAEWALIENLQREDLNPIERAEAFSHLADRFKLSHEQIAERVGVNRSSISNALRLLTLHPDVQQLIRDGLLSAGHAKAVAGVDDPKAQRALAVKTVKEDLSVRQVEALARQGGADGGAATGAAKKRARRQAHLADL